MPGSNSHIARHILTRTFTGKLYKTLGARDGDRMQSSSRRLVIAAS